MLVRIRCQSLSLVEGLVVFELFILAARVEGIAFDEFQKLEDFGVVEIEATVGGRERECCDGQVEEEDERKKPAHRELRLEDVSSGGGPI